MELRANIRRMLKRNKSSGRPDSAEIEKLPSLKPTVSSASLETRNTDIPAKRPPKVPPKPPSLLPQLDDDKSAVLHTSRAGSVGDKSFDDSVKTLAETEHRGSEEVRDNHNLKQQSTDHIEEQPTLIVSQPTPDVDDENAPRLYEPVDESPGTSEQSTPAETVVSRDLGLPSSIPSSSSSISPGTQASSTRPTLSDSRKQSLFTGANAPIIQSLLQEYAVETSSETDSTPARAASISAGVGQPNIAAMLHRKIWVKRPNASATMVTIKEDDLVDDVRDMVLRKYANSLGRNFDSPDVVLRIVTRLDAAQTQREKILSPEEEICRTLDNFYPGGQSIEEALIIDVPPKKTPRPSPRSHHVVSYAALDDYRPQESGSDYFPPMPAIMPPSNSNPNPTGSHELRALHAHSALNLPEHTRSISVLSTGQVPPLPSPGAASRRHRPKYGRQHTSSPTIISHPPHASNAGSVPINGTSLGPNHTLPHRPITRPRHDSNASDRPNGAPPAPPLPTPPAPEAPPTANISSTPPTPNAREHNLHRQVRPMRRSRKATPTNGTSTVKSPGLSSLLDNSVPPINVLIVEDNFINLRLLEAFMKRLKVRWSTAMNGQIAVNKWRTGSFHLVLMDIQLPIMSGLEATKEIRRLERVNGIGVFSSSTPTSPAPRGHFKSLDAGLNVELDGESQALEVQEPNRDKLEMDEGGFKSPVIIVALTASSLQSDRHEALAAGCNDFLTKPVNFVWLERKVKEWGCMQALIDFDGWRKWKDFSGTNGGATAAAEKEKADTAAKIRDKKAKRASRVSAAGSVDGLGAAGGVGKMDEVMGQAA